MARRFSSSMLFPQQQAVQQRIPTAMVPALTAVVLLPMSAGQIAWQQHVFQLAVAQAKAALEPPRYVRRFLASWN